MILSDRLSCLINGFVRKQIHLLSSSPPASEEDNAEAFSCRLKQWDTSIIVIVSIYVRTIYRTVYDAFTEYFFLQTKSQPVAELLFVIVKL